MRLLVIEDEPDLLAALAQSLRRAGASVRVVPNGQWTVSERDFQSPSPDAAVRTQLSSGPARKAITRSGLSAVRGH